jgi:hypothetical protein
MLKSLIIAADAVSPDYIVKKRVLFPNISKMMDNGATCIYSAYVQKGYKGSYSSEQNWCSIYTGLSPKEHKLDRDAVTYAPPKMHDFNGLQPIWKVLNDNELSVGLWSAVCCNYPIEIYGYAISNRYEPLFSPQEDREAPRIIMVYEKDKDLLRFLDGQPPPFLYPKTLKQQGVTFKELQDNPDLIDKIANEETLQPLLKSFEDELHFWFDAMTKAQHMNPVDVMYYFTPTIDGLGHFASYCDDSPVLIKAYQLLDSYIGRLISEFSPEITVLLSDHGQQNFKYLVNCSDPSTQREAFSARDSAIWLKNGYIALEALNGGLLFTAHSLKGVFIASGKGIERTEISEMRTVDIYPTLLEMLGVKAPSGRSGYVVDIFDKSLINADMLLKEKEIRYKKIALVQAHEMSVTDIILNELYIENRFAHITIAGEPKYEEIFRNNPRVSGFVPFEQFNATDYDEIFCGYYNENHKLMRHIKIYGSYSG